MYEYLSGEAPFTGASALEIMSKKMQGAASSITQFCQQTGVDAKLAALIFSALDPVPSKRPQSALEFSSQLMAMLQDAELAPLNLRRQKTGLQKKNRTTALILLSAGLLTSVVLLFLVLPNLQKPAVSGEDHLRPSRSQELTQIEKLKNGTEEQRLSAFFKLQTIPELEAGEEKIHRKNLGKAYMEIETLINDLEPMKIGPYTPDQLKEMSIDFSNKGCHLALLSGNADWFGFNCNNSFHMLVGNKNGMEIVQSRLAQARKNWPENNEVFRLHALAFQLLLKEKKLNDAAAVLQMASQIPKTTNAHVCSVWIDSMSANLAAQTGEKKKAEQLLSSVLEEFDSSAELSAKTRKELMESTLGSTFKALGQPEKFADFADKEFRKNRDLYESEGEQFAGDLCQLISNAYLEANEAEKCIYYAEKTLQYFEEGEKEKRLQILYKKFIEELSMMGPRYSATVEKYRHKLNELTRKESQSAPQ